jgi:hypothetical protein
MTSDDYAYVPSNLRSLSGVLRKPELSTISEQDPIIVIVVLQQFIQIYTSE